VSSKAEFTVRARGPKDHPKLTVEVESSYNMLFVDALKSNLKNNSERHWDPDAVRWWITPAALDKMIQIATKHYEKVYKVEGNKVTDCITGHSYEALNLFQ